MEKKLNFNQKVWNLCKLIPKGKVTTYKEIALALGTKNYRAVGQALKHNPYSPLVPCHRVVKSDGYIGGYKGNEVKQKVDLLIFEGILFKEMNKIDLEQYLFRF